MFCVRYIVRYMYPLSYLPARMSPGPLVEGESYSRWLSSNSDSTT